MNVKKTLDFVKGSVARKDFVPALTHLQMKDGFVYGFNGTLSLGARIDLDLNATPKAVTFIKAINSCGGSIDLSLTDSGKLRLKSKALTVHIPCHPEELPVGMPTGKQVYLGGEIIPALRSVAPFIAQDASRPWARGVYLNGPFANATNNICVVQSWLGFDFPVTAVIPEEAVKEILRVKEEPEFLLVNDSALTFCYSKERWITTSLLDPSWPDLTALLDRPCKPSPFPDGFFDALTELQPFCEATKEIHFFDGRLSTGRDDESTYLDCATVSDSGCFNVEQLLHLKGRATKVDFSMYPEACLFYGLKLRGAIIGIAV